MSTLLHPVPARKSTRRLEDSLVRTLCFLECAKHLTVYQTGRGSGRGGDGRLFLPNVSGFHVVRNTGSTKCNTTRGPRSAVDLFFASSVFQSSRNSMSDIRLPVTNSAHVISNIPELQAYVKSLNTRYVHSLLSSSHSFLLFSLLQSPLSLSYSTSPSMVYSSSLNTFLTVPRRCTPHRR